MHKINCSDCHASYIGETGRNLATRLTEHKRATRKGDVNNHIAEHHRLTNHTIDWDSAQCLTYSTNYFHPLTLESWFTNLEQYPLNRCKPQPAPYKRQTKQNDLTSLTDRERSITTDQRHLSLTANNITAKLTNQFIQTGLRTFDWQQLFTWLWWWLPLTLWKRQQSFSGPHSPGRSNHTITCYPRVQTIYCISICMAPLQYVYVNIFNLSTGDKRKKKCIAFLNLLHPFWNHWCSL